MRTYLLHDRVDCPHCTAQRPAGLVDENDGKMRPYVHNQNGHSYHRCISRERGYTKGKQRAVQVDRIDGDILTILNQLVVPPDVKQRIDEAVRARAANEEALKRIETVREQMARIDFSWEQGFLDKDAYAEKRRRVQHEMDSLRPVDYDDLLEAADLLKNFQTYWDACAGVGNPDEARKQLLAKVVDRVFVYNNRILAVVLHVDFALILGENTPAPTEVEGAVRATIMEAGITAIVNSQDGDDGFRLRPVYLLSRYGIDYAIAQRLTARIMSQSVV